MSETQESGAATNKAAVPEPSYLYEAPKPHPNMLRNVLMAVGLIYVVVSLYLLVDARGRVDKLEQAEQANNSEVKTLAKRLGTTDSNLKTSTEELGARLGMTEQDLQNRMAERAAQLERQQHAAEQRLSKEHRQEMSQVSGEVAGVKTELGTTQTDLATTKSDLASTKERLDRTIGDQNVMSGLIAHNSQDVEYLKHRGDRNYYEFTLAKGAMTPVSTISLQLKKADAKRGKFTLNVVADDRKIEKKDRTMLEPMQFYTGRDRMLYEIVVFTVEKNRVKGYLSTPKNAPAPFAK
jgi:DNA repair exonuclease SbcCD ATPase subunit